MDRGRAQERPRARRGCGLRQGAGLAWGKARAQPGVWCGTAWGRPKAQLGAGHGSGLRPRARSHPQCKAQAWTRGQRTSATWGESARSLEAKARVRPRAGTRHA